MREIKFRGKREDNGEWVYGAFVPDALEGSNSDLVSWGFIRRYNRCIGKMETIEVDRETVGQYTGLKDRNGTEIYEGDIVDNGHTVVYSSSAHQFRYIGIVKFDVKQGCLVIHNTDGNTKRITAKTVQTNKIKVLGNIYDNPELVGCKNEV